jgi:hypothetical protein
LFADRTMVAKAIKLKEPTVHTSLVNRAECRVVEPSSQFAPPIQTQ